VAPGITKFARAETAKNAKKCLFRHRLLESSSHRRNASAMCGAIAAGVSCVVNRRTCFPSGDTTYL
jgi:hypothetical protein